MSRFSIRNPYFIIVICLALIVIGVTSLLQMPVDLFPSINLPEVVVATFYSGMPPQDIETDITNPLERFFTLASGIDHMESRSLLGVSMIKVYFQSGTDADADVTELSNLALADLKRLPPGTLPPVVLKFDASSLPVWLMLGIAAGLQLRVWRPGLLTTAVIFGYSQQLFTRLIDRQANQLINAASPTSAAK